MHLVLVVEEPPQPATATGDAVAADLVVSPNNAADAGLPTLVGCATLLLERSPLALPRGGSSGGSSLGGSGGGLIGRIEDVVIDGSTRGTGLGKAMINTLVSIAKERGAVCLGFASKRAEHSLEDDRSPPLTPQLVSDSFAWVPCAGNCHAQLQRSQ